MKLLNRTIVCSGKLGCAMVFEFHEDDTTEYAAKVLRAHRAEPGHVEQVLQETNVRRTLDGLAPITMDELLDRPAQKIPEPETSERSDEIILDLGRQNRESLSGLRMEVERMKADAARIVQTITQNVDQEPRRRHVCYGEGCCEETFK